MVIPLDKPHRAIVCNSMWALTDFTEANGATRLVPGSHKKPSPEYGGHYDTIPAEMKKGSVLDLGRFAVAWRRRQQDRQAAHGHRDELLRRASSASRRTSSSASRPNWSKRFRRGCRNSSATASIRA